MNIRRANSQDIPAIMEIIREVVPLMHVLGNFQWNEDYPNPDVFAEDIAEQQLWVAELDGKIVGLSAITTEQYPEYAQVGWDISEPAIVTHRLAVDPDVRGKGVADKLLKQAEDEAQRRGSMRLRIDTNAENKAAQKLFVKMGYVYAGDITLEFRPGLLFCCFEKLL